MTWFFQASLQTFGLAVALTSAPGVSAAEEPAAVAAPAETDQSSRTDLSSGEDQTEGAGEPSTSARASKSARRTRFAESAPFDVVGGGSRPGAWAGAVQVGYPWQTLRFQYGARLLTPLVEFETALFRRFRPAIGLGLRWIDRPRVRLTGDILLGWLIQTDALARRGPNGELRLRLAFPSGRVAPYLMLATRHTLLFDRTRVVGPGGTTTSWGVRHDWTPWATLGLAIAIRDDFGVEVGIDWPWVGAPEGVAIPGIHVGALFGGGR